MRHILLAAAAALTAQAAMAQQAVTYTVDQSYDDVTFGLENAITDAGLVVDHISHVGEMLERTRADVGSEVTIFTQADVYSFCSAVVSRKVMEADPMNIAFCPYGIFVAQMPGDEARTVIGYRSYPEGPMQEVQAMLDKLTKTAIGME